MMNRFFPTFYLFYFLFETNECFSMKFRNKEKSKITKLLNSEENTKRKVPNQMAKSNDKTHQTNGQQLSHS